jgi:hypothetical protein
MGQQWDIRLYSGLRSWAKASIAFCYCDKTSDTNNFREEEFILVPGCRGFSPWLAGCTALAMVRQNIMAEGCGRGKLLTCSWLRNREVIGRCQVLPEKWL